MDTQFDETVAASLDRSVTGRFPTRPRKTLRERLRPFLLLGFPLLLAVAGGAYYVAEEPYVSTDDAFVRVAKESINARVSGQVVEIAVKDNQRVRMGQLLFRIDPRPYQIAVAEAEARLGSARLQIGELKATYRQQLVELQSARDSAEFDEREYARKSTLVADNWTPRAVYERAQTISKLPASTSHRLSSRSPTLWSPWTATRISRLIVTQQFAKPRRNSIARCSICPTRPS